MISEPERGGLCSPLPTLVLGAVDVLSGAFKAFDSRKGEISLDSVLASTILPELFRARTIGNQEYWDGLYSENPPVRGFVELPDEPDEKPDEIWLVKIDPPERLSAPEDPDAIADRRNQLAGDLSLNQELCAIESINQWLGKFNAVSRRKYKHVSILRMQLDPQQRFAGVPLDVKSKMYRGGKFIRRSHEAWRRPGSRVLANCSAEGAAAPSGGARLERPDGRYPAGCRRRGGL